MLMRNYPRDGIRKMIVILTLVFSDGLLALLIGQLATLLSIRFSQGQLSGGGVAGTLPAVAIWLVARALAGLYPGHELTVVDALRRHGYAVVISVGIVIIVILAMQLVGLVSYVWLTLFFGGLLLLNPFTRYLTRWGLRNRGLLL